MRLIPAYSWPGLCSMAANMTPIQSPPDPKPISVRAPK